MINALKTLFINFFKLHYYITCGIHNTKTPQSLDFGPTIGVKYISLYN